MPDLCIQVHPHRSPTLDLQAVQRVCEALTRSEPVLIQRFGVSDGVDGHAYADLVFETADTRWLWNTIRRLLYDAGGALVDCSMAICEGRDGWNDYLLLYHFDPDVDLDRLPADSSD